MVDPIGAKPVTTTGQRGVARAEAPTRIAAPATGSSAGTPTLAASLAAAPPIDLERISVIRKAIEEGRFPLSPSTIADRLIALKLSWNSNDQA